jgi:hypothetical protein
MEGGSMVTKTVFNFALIVLLSCPIILAQKTDKDSGVNRSLQRELIKLGKADQKYRWDIEKLAPQLAGPNQKKVTEKFIEVVKKQDAIDAQNIRRLEGIIGQYGWPGKRLVGTEASRAAFLILQHAELK